ncbi:patatin-like phospholipase family protein [Sphingomonas sp. 8AM]|uniref:patatin-like phospholipase family protein n=1 Tax=Sphingomonas sp. 8AM TaxID=2653170 RepID=UPI0012F2EEFA|nr:patatin-like phospholipase family protein [Sphingomonas sp. 8AM]VXC29318.1 conserved hypothetical protein [Sphingomonas sp. 8AM]
MATAPTCDIALVLSGGNALGAYQAGAYQALDDAGIVPDRIVGTSIGAINGALIAGNAPADRLPRLADFWRPAPAAAADWLAIPDDWRRTGEVLGTMLRGRAGMFSPPGATLPGGRPALYDTAPLMRTLAQSIDFDRLNTGAIRYTATAVDLDTGCDATFDTAALRVTPAHICASGSLPPGFPPVTIDGVRYVDGGLSANLPLDPLLSDPGDRPLWCIAIDLLPLAAHNPATLGAMAERAQDLTFAIQSRRSITRWRERYATDPAFAERAVTLSPLTYADQQPEVAGKAMDFSPASVRRRWDAGHRDASALVARWGQGALPIGERGLHLG